MAAKSTSLVTFEIDSFIKGYHVYQYDWTPKRNEVPQAVMEPENPVDKYAVCVKREGDQVVGHLQKGKNGRFAKTVFYFLRANPQNTCTVTVHGKAVNLGDGDGMQVPCKLYFSGEEKFTRILKRELLA